MDERYSFQEAVLMEKRTIAFDDGDMSRYDSIGEQLSNLQKAHENAEISRNIDFLKHAASLLISHFVELEAPKVKLLSKTVNIMSFPDSKNISPKTEPDSISTIATGWLLYASETEFEKSDSVQTVYRGYIINKSKNIFGFKNSELVDEKGKTSYVISKYSTEYLSMTKDLSKPYPDLDEAVVGEINRLNYRDDSQRSGIESILAYAAINEGMEKKVISTWSH